MAIVLTSVESIAEVSLLECVEANAVASVVHRLLKKIVTRVVSRVSS